MSCYHPQNAVVLGVDPSTGKKKLKFLGADVVSSALYPGKEVLQVPCGQCIGCRIDRSRQWANRCMLELQYHDSAYFVTLSNTLQLRNTVSSVSNITCNGSDINSHIKTLLS